MMANMGGGRTAVSEKESSEQLLQRTADFVGQHLARYLASGGREGHIESMSHVGVPWRVPTLLLRTIGRRSGRPLTVPLIYGYFGGEWVVVGSKGGHHEHPAWYLNLQGRQAVYFQIATQCFRGSWRVAQGEERARVWDYMARLFPPYEGYVKAAGDRVLPVVMLQALEAAPIFTAD